MNIEYRELRFLIFFIPVFFLKLINITASDKLLVIVSISCFIFFTICILGNEKMGKAKIISMVFLVVFTSILVLTCGKQGAFFSAIMIVALSGIKSYKKIYKVLMAVGSIALLVSMYIERNGQEGARYINGQWVSIYKRSNILYISFFTVVCLYLFQQNKLKYKQLFTISVIGIIMYKYTGSRTGLLMLIGLVFLLIILRKPKIFHNRIINKLCIFSPLISLCISLFMTILYGNNSAVNILNMMMQGRIYQNNLFFNSYGIKLFGQHIFESMDANNYQVLDCAYMDMLICYGLLFTIIWILGSIVVIKYLYVNERYIEVAIMVVYSIYGISETFLPNCYLNVSLFLYAECLFYMIEHGKIKIKCIR